MEIKPLQLRPLSPAELAGAIANLANKLEQAGHDHKAYTSYLERLTAVVNYANRQLPTA